MPNTLTVFENLQAKQNVVKHFQKLANFVSRGEMKKGENRRGRRVGVGVA
jgi:hypothetical protein